MIHLDKRQEKTLSIPVALTNFDVWTTNAGHMSPALKRLAHTAYLFFVCLLVCVCRCMYECARRRGGNKVN